MSSSNVEILSVTNSREINVLKQTISNLTDSDLTNNDDFKKLEAEVNNLQIQVDGNTNQHNNNKNSFETVAHKSSTIDNSGLLTSDSIIKNNNLKAKTLEVDSSKLSVSTNGDCLIEHKAPENVIITNLQGTLQGVVVGGIMNGSTVPPYVADESNTSPHVCYIYPDVVGKLDNVEIGTRKSITKIICDDITINNDVTMSLGTHVLGKDSGGINDQSSGSTFKSVSADSLTVNGTDIETAIMELKDILTKLVKSRNVNGSTILDTDPPPTDGYQYLYPPDVLNDINNI